MIKRKHIFIASALALSVCIFVYGVLVGARQYPPYHALVLVKAKVLGQPLHPNHNFYTVDQRYLETDPEKLIQLQNAQDVDTKRKHLAAVIWNNTMLPLGALPRVEERLTCEDLFGRHIFVVVGGV